LAAWVRWPSRSNGRNGLRKNRHYLIGVVVTGGAFQVDVDPSPWQQTPDAKGIFPLRLATTLN
jgi:hypothetical protein